MSWRKLVTGLLFVTLLATGVPGLSACGDKKANTEEAETAGSRSETSSVNESDSEDRAEPSETGGFAENAGNEANTGADRTDSGADQAAEDERQTAVDEGQTAADANSGLRDENALTPVAAEPEDDDLVRVRDYIPDILVDLKYATEDNFTGQIIYEFKDAYLRYGTVQRLQNVQEAMREQGLTLKIWDAFRPLWAQQALWDAYPDTTYVSNPEERGYTSHNFGNTVDLTVVREDGSEIPMPTGFDDFSLRADRDYDDCTEEEAENAWMLDQAMSDAGFEGYWGEWWHYQDIDEYPGEDLEGAVLK